jgi:hypothetical protein
MAKHEYFPALDFVAGTIKLECTYVRGIGYYEDCDNVHIIRVEWSDHRDFDTVSRHLDTSWQQFRTMHDGTQTSPDMWVDPMTGTIAGPEWFADDHMFPVR